MPLVPTSLAAEMARENPAFLGKRLKECYLARDGAAVREMLMPNTPMFGRVDPSPTAPGALGFGSRSRPSSAGSEEGAGGASLEPLVSD